MLHDRIMTLVDYVAQVLAGEPSTSILSRNHRLINQGARNSCDLGSAKQDHEVLRSLAALVASLPASENKHFRKEFDTVSRQPTHPRTSPIHSAKCSLQSLSHTLS